MGLFFKAPSAPPTELEQLQLQLAENQKELARAYMQFDYVSDPELVDACVYEIKALQTRSNYLLRSIKALENPAKNGGEALWA